MASKSEWARRISEADGRPCHPEDYGERAERLMGMPNPEESWRRILDNRADEGMHTDFRFSFLDWFGYETEGETGHPGARSRPADGGKTPGETPSGETPSGEDEWEPCWWCDDCASEKSPHQVTYQERCTVCGDEVVWLENRAQAVEHGAV